MTHEDWGVDDWGQRAEPGQILAWTTSRKRMWVNPPQRPTFDEWHLAKFGMTFDDQHQQPSMRMDLTMRALSRKLRDYTSEMVRR